MSDFAVFGANEEQFAIGGHGQLLAIRRQGKGFRTPAFQACHVPLLDFKPVAHAWKNHRNQ